MSQKVYVVSVCYQEKYQDFLDTYTQHTAIVVESLEKAMEFMKDKSNYADDDAHVRWWWMVECEVIGEWASGGPAKFYDRDHNELPKHLCYIKKGEM